MSEGITNNNYERILIMKTLRRKLCVLLTFVMVMTASFGTCTFAYAKEANNSKASYKVESKIVPIYMFAATAESTQDINLYYINGSDVPYMKLEDWTERIRPLLSEFSEKRILISKSRKTAMRMWYIS